MRFDNASHVEDVVWLMRLADLPRGENRTILNQLYNGDPPFDEALAEENNVEINRNDLTGPNLLAQARRQWYQAFLTSENYFTITLDSGPPTKRREWGHTITKHVNRFLKESKKQKSEKRSTGGQTMLHGVGPVTWNDRRSVVPVSVPISSVMIPSETEIDFENLAYFAVFREWTPAQLYSLTHGPKVDPGWNMDLVKSQLRYVGEQVQKQPNATAYQYMPERIEELVKQDMGFWGSDAVPTVDVWDFFFREAEEDGKGWYRRTILDWGVAEGLTKESPKPSHGNKDADGVFLYNSGNRKYANSINEILHCQFADCSAVFPQKYHSVRSLGWMLWGTCDLQNRLHCKFNESVFEQLMWFFRVASNQDIARLKRANFMHMGAIPAGIDWVKAQERYVPPLPLIEYAFNRSKGLLNESASSFTQDFARQGHGKEMTATETMAIVNSVNALVSGMLTLAYDYEDDKHREECRRITLPNNTDKLAKKIITACLNDGVPSEYLKAERWIVRTERILGAGNKTVGLAQANYLQSIRKNLGPEAQRQVDHIGIATNTDDPALAEQLAPLAGMQVASSSMHDAQLSTERLMRGLPLVPRPDMVYEDYVKVWIADLGLMVGRAAQTNLVTPEDILGWETMSKQIQDFLKIIATNDEEMPKVKKWANQLKDTMNIVKKLAVILQQKQGAEGGEVDKVEMAKIQLEKAKAEQKMRERQQSHAARTAQRQVQFDLEQQREDRRTNADIRRENAKAAHELVRNRMTTFAE